jgi:hypothetical protein
VSAAESRRYDLEQQNEIWEKSITLLSIQNPNLMPLRSQLLIGRAQNNEDIQDYNVFRHNFDAEGRDLFQRPPEECCVASSI